MKNSAEKIYQLLTIVIERIERTAVSLPLLIGSFFALIGVRLFVENSVFGYTRISGSYYLYEFSHTLTFFTLTFILIITLFAWYFSRSLQRVATVFLCGFIVIILPPLIDVVIAIAYYPGQSFLSYYEFDSLRGLVARFYTFYGDDPTNGITYGVRIEVALVLMLIFIYGIVVSKSFWRAFLFLIPAYIVFFVLGTFPAWLTLIGSVWSLDLLTVQASDVAQIFLSPTRIFVHDLPGFLNALNAKMSLLYTIIICFSAGLLFWVKARARSRTFFFAMRPLQMVYHVGLLCVGMGIGMLLTDEIWFVNFFTISAFAVLCISVVSAWISATLVNDLFDQETDRISNKERPLIRGTFTVGQYHLMAWLFAGLAIFSAAIINPKVAGFIIAYLALTWLYNVPPLRLKRLPLVASFTAAVASLLIILMGYSIFTPQYSIVSFPFVISALFVIVLTISLPLKDLKDIEGDKKMGTWTLPVLLGAKKARLIIASGVLLSFFLSVVFLRMQELFIWAVLCGGIAFWLIIASDGRMKIITSRNVLAWIFLLTGLYGAILVATLLF